MTRPCPMQWDGEAMRPTRGFVALANQQYVVGEVYTLEPADPSRSSASHRHYFAAVYEAWLNLGEHDAERFPTADHLRKYALIRAGYRDERSIVCSSKAEAVRVGAFVKPMDEYAVVAISEAVVPTPLLGASAMRAVEIWVGKTDDEKIPARVKLRIWNREGGRCSLTGRKILVGDQFDYEHRIALCNGGRHAEDNIVLALRGKVHQAKTAADVALKAKLDRIAKKHTGIWPKSPHRLQGRGFSPSRKASGIARMSREDQ